MAKTKVQKEIKGPVKEEPIIVGLTHGHHKSILVITILLALVAGIYIGATLFNALGAGADMSAISFGLVFTNTVVLIIIAAVVVKHHAD